MPLMLLNPNRPTKEFMRRCLAGIGPGAADPGAVCASTWQKLSAAGKRKWLARENPAGLEARFGLRAIYIKGGRSHEATGPFHSRTFATLPELNRWAQALGFKWIERRSYIFGGYYNKPDGASLLPDIFFPKLARENPGKPMSARKIADLLGAMIVGGFKRSSGAESTLLAGGPEVDIILRKYLSAMPGEVRLAAQEILKRREAIAYTRPGRENPRFAALIRGPGGEPEAARHVGRAVKVGRETFYLSRASGDPELPWTVTDPVSGHGVAAGKSAREALGSLKKRIKDYGGPAGFMKAVNEARREIMARLSHPNPGAAWHGHEAGVAFEEQEVARLKDQPAREEYFAGMEQAHMESAAESERRAEKRRTPSGLLGGQLAKAVLGTPYIPRRRYNPTMHYALAWRDPGGGPTASQRFATEAEAMRAVEAMRTARMLYRLVDRKGQVLAETVVGPQTRGLLRGSHPSAGKYNPGPAWHRREMDESNRMSAYYHQEGMLKARDRQRGETAAHRQGIYLPESGEAFHRRQAEIARRQKRPPQEAPPDTRYPREYLAGYVSGQLHSAEESRHGNPGAYPYMDAWDVYLRGERIDTVFRSSAALRSMSPKELAEDIRRSLVEHDNYDPAIVVRLRRRKMPARKNVEGARLKRLSGGPEKSYRGFHGAPVDSAREVKVPADWPRKLWMLGRMDEMHVSLDPQREGGLGMKLHGGTVAVGPRNGRLYIIGAMPPLKAGTVGLVKEISYTPPKRSGKAFGGSYVHAFDRPPRLTGRGGRFLEVSGQGLKLTRRGIVG